MTPPTPSTPSAALGHHTPPQPHAAGSSASSPLPSSPAVSAISLFVDDLNAARRFYREVFQVPVLFQDDVSVVVQFENLVVNLLRREAAVDIVAPGSVARQDAGSSFQLSVWVPDVDAVCNELRRRGVQQLHGPVDRPWGMRTANFVDPGGHSWEVGQRL